MKRIGTRNIFSLGLIKPGSHMWLMLNPSQLRRRAGSRVVTKIFSCQVNIYIKYKCRWRIKQLGNFLVLFSNESS